MTVDLFAGLPVSDLDRAVTWYGRLLGAEPSMYPNDAEAVWQVGEHGHVYVRVQPDDAGGGQVTLFVDDVAERVDAIRARGVEPDQDELYDNGVRKVTYRDPDGNEVGLGGTTAT